MDEKTLKIVEEYQTEQDANLLRDNWEKVCFCSKRGIMFPLDDKFSKAIEARDRLTEKWKCSAMECLVKITGKTEEEILNS